MTDFNDFFNQNGTADQFNQLWAHYQNMGEEDMKNEIMTTLINARNSGQLSEETLIGYYHTLSPYLTNEQRSNLWQVINELKY